MREDDGRIRRGDAAENLAAFNILGLIYFGKRRVLKCSSSKYV